MVLPHHSVPDRNVIPTRVSTTALCFIGSLEAITAKSLSQSNWRISNAFQSVNLVVHHSLHLLALASFAYRTNDVPAITIMRTSILALGRVSTPTSVDELTDDRK